MKTILITGATDGIGLATAQVLLEQGHHVLLHGRNPNKLADVKKHLATKGQVESYVADLSSLIDVEKLAQAVSKRHTTLDVLINNAGVLKTASPMTAEGLDIRFAVNTVAPYLLTKRLLPLIDKSARIINVSSAAQYPVQLDALTGKVRLREDFNTYAQSKLAITMWSRYLAQQANSPMIVAINPGSLLGTKMVKEGFGMAGKAINIGADILVKAALSDEFAEASGLYFDNDSGQFASPHLDALDEQKVEGVVGAIEEILDHY